MGTTPQPFTAYDTALRFCHASTILYERHQLGLQTLHYEDAGLIIPFMVNCSFACELFLKALIASPAKGHRLGELFKCLQSSNSETAESIKVSVLAAYEKSDKKLIGSFEEELALVERTFEQIRYNHEPNMVGPHAYNYLFLFVFMILLKAHAEYKYGKRPTGEPW